MATLIESLFVSGSRLSTGEPNSSGVVYAYEPGTTSPAVLYADADATIVAPQPITLDDGGRIPRPDYAAGIWTISPVRLLIQDVSGNVVSDSTYWPGDARADALDNAGFTGATVDDALSAIYASTGAADAKYLESAGATPRLIQDKFREKGISVTDYGAVGNGIAVDTTAIQTAANRAKALGANLLFPAGTFKIDQAISISSPSGVRVIGQGQSATIILQTNGAANGFTISNSTDCSVEQMTIQSSGSSTGAGIAFTAGSLRPSIVSVNVVGTTTPDGFFTGATITGTGTTAAIVNSSMLNGQTNGLVLTNVAVGFVSQTQLVSNNSNSALLFTGTTSNVTVSACRFFGATGADFGTTSGTGFNIVNCPTLGTNTTTPINLSGLGSDPILQQTGNCVDSVVYSVAVGSTIAIKLSDGNSPILRAASGGAGTVTVSAPVPVPTTSAVGPAVYLRTQHVNASGGAVTWSMDASFVLTGAVAIPGTNGHTIEMAWRWDRLSSKWREIGRSDTTT